VKGKGSSLDIAPLTILDSVIHGLLTDPWGMDGWVGHIGWPIADGLTTKWSPIQLAVWRRIGKVRWSGPVF